MHTFIKWIGIAIGGLIGLALLALITIYFVTENQIDKRYEVAAAQIEIPDALPPQESGWPLMLMEFCVDCHGPDYGGAIMEDDPLMARIVAPNLTSGKGGVGNILTDEDWVLALRHGIGQDRKSLIVMPSDVFTHLSDEDLSLLIAYLKTLPPVDRQLPATSVGPIGRIFILQEPAVLPAAVIDHFAPPPARSPTGVTLENGKYLTTVCTVCHEKDLSGGQNASAGLDLTPAGDLKDWTEAEFIETMRTGVTPEGETMDPIEMPWKTFGQFSDEELKAIYLYLSSLPPAVSTAP